MATKQVQQMTESDDQEDQFVVVENKADLTPPGEEDDHEDERLGDAHELANSTDAEREAIRERRRQEKVDRKDRRETAIKRDKIERDFLLKRNDELERRLGAQEQRTHVQDLNGFDAGIQQQLAIVRQADEVIAKAVAAGNGDDMVQAQRYRDDAMGKANALHFQKQQAAARPPVPAAAVPDQLAMQYAQAFIAENKWYDPRGQNEESAIMLAIDAGLVRDGYSPLSEDYWDELRARGAKRLPERFKPARGQGTGSAEHEDRQARGGPQLGSGREHAPSSTRKEIYISPDRKAALIEAGVWDDPVLRQKYVKRYADYDRTNKN